MMYRCPHCHLTWCPELGDRPACECNKVAPPIELSSRRRMKAENKRLKAWIWILSAFIVIDLLSKIYGD